ncbi:carbohydrate ABC transporter permease [Chitiniphilus eburneus]|uniref:Carbohydrate ABC transporter permease n=1 Tax=Chitiniphilus eburneus TaxID=2571148 RepID=A0A4U0P903_9NEIS|nr:carbohydrate ABC transporter permease [Chitiniphilus eburneus]TJZ64047.1 carbohydrate ABC transporter permease [Chitiniphilus eburneus]
MRRVLAWGVMLGGVALMLLPFWFMLVFATHDRAAIFQLPPPLWFGDGLRDNLAILTQRLPFWRNVGMSLYVAGMTTALALLLCSMAGYAFAVHRFRGQRILFALVVASMMLPPYLAMVPGYLVMDALGWVDAPRALWLPGAASAFGVYLMRHYITHAVPRSLIEAARIDGCGEWRLFWSIALPQCRPALSALGLIVFVGSWNNFIAPLVVMRSMERYPLPLALRTLQAQLDTQWGALMAGSAIATVPLLLLFVFASRRLMAGAVVVAGDEEG